MYISKGKGETMLLAIDTTMRNGNKKKRFIPECCLTIT